MEVKLPYDILSYKEEFFDATELTPELASTVFFTGRTCCRTCVHLVLCVFALNNRILAISEQMWAQDVVKEAFKNRTKAAQIQVYFLLRLADF